MAPLEPAEKALLAVMEQMTSQQAVMVMAVAVAGQPPPAATEMVVTVLDHREQEEMEHLRQLELVPP